jgi:hypothetical protein
MNSLEPKIAAKSLNDVPGDKLCIIYDQLTESYGVFVNCSLPFDDYKYGYNYLHFFEHIMTYAWRRLDKKDIVDINGTTVCNGICTIYVVLKSKEAAEKYTNSLLAFIDNIRTEGFWEKDLKKARILETSRTMSETQPERSYANSGRTDTSVYKKGYDVEILKYFACKPMTIFIVSPEDIRGMFNESRLKNLDKKPFYKLPPPPTYNYYPVHVLRDKSDRDYFILPRKSIEKLLKASKRSCISIKENKECDKKNIDAGAVDTESISTNASVHVVSGDDNKVGYLDGIDCCLFSRRNNLSFLNNYLFVICTKNMKFIHRFIKYVPLPYHTDEYITNSLCLAAMSDASMIGNLINKF